MNSSGSEYGQMVGPSEHGNETWGFVQFRELTDFFFFLIFFLDGTAVQHWPSPVQWTSPSQIS